MKVYVQFALCSQLFKLNQYQGMVNLEFSQAFLTEKIVLRCLTVYMSLLIIWKQCPCCFDLGSRYIYFHVKVGPCCFDLGSVYNYSPFGVSVYNYSPSVFM